MSPVAAGFRAPYRRVALSLSKSGKGNRIPGVTLPERNRERSAVCWLLAHLEYAFDAAQTQ